MRRSRTVGLGIIAAVALSTTVTSGASAMQPRQLTLETAKRPLSVGANVVATSSDLTTATSTGTLKCSKSVLAGTLRSIKAGSTTVTVRQASATGCTSLLGATQIATLNLPWTLVFSRTGVSVLSSASELAFKSTFSAAPGLACVFERATLATNFPVSKAARPVVLTASDQVFTRDDAASSTACPQSGEMSGHFKVTSGGKTVLASYS